MVFEQEMQEGEEDGVLVILNRRERRERSRDWMGRGWEGTRGKKRDGGLGVFLNRRPNKGSEVGVGGTGLGGF